MKRVLVTLFVLFNVFNTNVSAQTYFINYSKHFSNKDWIEAYQDKIEGTPITLKGPSERLMPILFNDSISFCDIVLFGWETEEGIIKQFKKLSKRKVLQWGCFTLKQNDSTYNLRYGPKKKEKIFIQERLAASKWLYDTTGKTYSILGYKCHSAYSLYENGDTAFAYYTNELPAGYGPAYFRGLNGFVLAAHDQQHSLTFVAKSIEKISYGLKIPEGFLILTTKEYNASKSIPANK